MKNWNWNIFFKKSRLHPNAFSIFQILSPCTSLTLMSCSNRTFELRDGLPHGATSHSHQGKESYQKLIWKTKRHGLSINFSPCQLQESDKYLTKNGIFCGTWLCTHCKKSCQNLMIEDQGAWTIHTLFILPIGIQWTVSHKIKWHLSRRWQCINSTQ